MQTPIHTPPHPESDSYLRSNSDAYEWLANKIGMMDLLERPEEVLSEVAKAAQFAVEFHTGRFADGAIENIALQIGMNLENRFPLAGDFSLASRHKTSRRRILHVSTSVVGIGGHTRMLRQWIQNDPSSCHSVVLISQNDVPVPRDLIEAVRDTGGTVVTFARDLQLRDKAQTLRNIARQDMDLVVLHHFGSDVVPTVAFAVRECPPVAILNHADHLFWMGSSVADMVINLRTVGAVQSAEQRFVSCNRVIPIPLSSCSPDTSREDARRALGIENDQVVLLSVGRPEKYRPTGPYDFVATANKILNRQPHAHLYVVGESASGISPYLRGAINERMHFVGTVENPSLYRAAADVYLESFPFGSQTALLEAALSGLAVVPAYSPLFPLLVANDDSLTDILRNPIDELGYMARVEQLIGDQDERFALGDELRARLLVDHVGQGWSDRLAAIYEATDRLTHKPRPIPVSRCKMTDADVNLSLWHVMAGRTFAVSAMEGTEQSIRCHAALVAKTVGDYSGARRYAWRALRYDPCRRALWRLMAIALLGRMGRVLRLWLPDTHGRRPFARVGDGTSPNSGETPSWQHHVRK